MRSVRFPWKLGASSSLALAVALLATGGGAWPARAEWAFDAYLGPTFPESEDTGAGQSSDFDGNITSGARVGYYFSLVRHLDLGLLLDASGVFQDIDGFRHRGTAPGGATIEVDEGDIDFNFVPISPLLLLRVPLGSTSDFVHGRYQLYGGGGPSLVWSEVNGGTIDDQSLDFGFDIRGGFNFMIVPMWGVFIEYRYTYFEPDFDHDSTIGGKQFVFKANVDSSTHHVLFGTGLRF